MANDFLLNTNGVELESSKISELSSTAEKALNSSNSYVVNSTDFDFSPAISAIKSNMQNIYEKVKVSSDILNKIVKIHTNLQESIGEEKQTTSKTTTSTPTIYSTATYYSSSSTSGETAKVYTPAASVASVQQPVSYTAPVTTVATTATAVMPTAAAATSITTEVTTGLSEKFDYSKLMRLGKIVIVPEEDLEKSTKDYSKLIVRINKNDPDYEKNMEMLYNIAKEYGIVLGIILIPDSAKDKTISVSLVKKGIEEGRLEGEEVTKEKVKELFENAPDDVKKDYNAEEGFEYYKQGDYKNSYAGGTIATSGCGPTSAAMVLTYLKGTKVTPPQVGTYSTSHGFTATGKGTYETLFPSIGESYGLKVVKEEQTATNIINSLKEGNVIIAHMGPGEFTKGGHYIVLRKVDENGNILVADPANPAKNKWYPASIFENQKAGSIYSFSVPV